MSRTTRNPRPSGRGGSQFSYTLGKLEILALRDRVGGDLRRFHDRLLAGGTPPPAIAARRLLPV